MFSCAAVVMVDEVGELSPFTTRSGGDCAPGAVDAEGFKALTTSLMALDCLTRDLIGLAHRGSGAGRVRRAEVGAVEKQTAELSHAVWAPSGEEGLCLVGVGGVDEVAGGGGQRGGRGSGGTHTKQDGLETMSFVRRRLGQRS